MDGQNYINEIAFSQPVINVGADSGNDIILRGQGIADFHLMLNYASNVWHLIPLDPSCMTLVNGRGVGPEGCTVKTGSVLSIGDYRLTLSLNGTNADIMVAQLASAIQNQSSAVFTEESEGSSILLALSDKLVPSEIEAGSSVEYELTVTNAGPLVANMQLQLQGIPTAWVQIIPPVLNLNEGRSGSFTVRVSPPRSSAAKAGLYQLHFVALSPNYPRETGVADAMLTILPYSDFLVNGPTPRRLNLSRSHSSDYTDLNIINNSNAASTFVVRSYDDANELNFAYKQDSGNLTQGQVTVTVRPGDNDRVPIRVETRKRPIIGFTNHTHHFYTSVSPTDRPGEAQTLLGEVMVRPMIHVIWLVIILILLAVAALIFFQPYIYQFDSLAGKRTEVILSGNSVGMNWNVSRFASKITLNDEKQDRQVFRQGNEFVSPEVSTTYTLKAENIISSLTSSLLGINPPEKEFHVLLIPRRPTIDVFKTDTVRTNYSQPVRLSWAVSSNTDSADLVTNKQSQSLAPENYSGNQSNTYTSDALISLKARNASGYEEKSVFVNVIPDKINLKKFIAWVRPNGIAVPSDNDIRRTTRWGSLQLYSAVTPSPQTIRPAVNPQPDTQSSAILIPDNYASAGSSQGGISPEQQSVNNILNSNGSDGLLVGPYTDTLPTPVPTAVPTAAVSVRSPIVSSSALSNSPEGGSAAREFSIKLVEAVEDPMAESGYRIIQYFPDHVLQKGEQIRIEWEVEGIPQVSIENLSEGAMTASGSEFAYPEKSTNYVLNAVIGELKKAYSLPVNVAGESDDGEGSGLQCELKANSTTLAVPGTVMLTWTGGGNNRVQLISSIKAEQENSDAEKQKEAEAKEKGEEYVKPTNAPLSGGIIGDYLQPSGFMRVNVDKQTTFVLNAYDGNGNVICSKDVEIKYTGGNDKLDLKMAITRIADTNDVEQAYYTVGQTVQFTVALTDYEKDREPTGSVMLTDGDSTCTMTLPKNTCSMVMKHAGERTVTATYSGDDAYGKKTAKRSFTVIEKMPTTTQINSAFRPAAGRADVEMELIWDANNSYGLIPTGIVTLVAGNGTCDVNMDNSTLSCDGTMEKKVDNESGRILLSLKGLELKDASAKNIRATYKGDDYFITSAAQSVDFKTVPTTLEIKEPYKHDITYADIMTILGWNADDAAGYTPTGTIKFTIRNGSSGSGSSGDSITGTCMLDIEKKTINCEPGTAGITVEGGELTADIKSLLLADRASDRVKAEYSGDSIFEPSESTVVLFTSYETQLEIEDNAAKDSEQKISLKTKLTWDEKEAGDATPTGTITYTSGSAVCALDITKLTFIDCQGNAMLDADGAIIITNMVMNGTPGDSISAKYEGDVLFKASKSETVRFKSIPTDISLTNTKKSSEGLIDLTARLTWADDTVTNPQGTISFTSGDTVCKLNISLDPPKLMDCKGQVTTTSADNELTFEITNLDAGGGSEIKADYSGDDYFLASSSDIIDFNKVDTTLDITDALKNGPDYADISAALGWDDTKAEGKLPTGTVKFTAGTGSCTLDIVTGVLDCEPKTGIVDADRKNISIVKMLLADNKADRVKAEYSGDAVFNPSASTTVLFRTVPTTVTFDLEEGIVVKPDTGHAVISELHLNWKTDETDGRTPKGTITLTVGEGSCVLDAATGKLSGCTGTSAAPSLVEDSAGQTAYYSYTIRDMALSDKNAPSVKASYAGDGFFEPSSSDSVDFEKIPTVLDITYAYKPETDHADMDTLLSWTTKGTAGMLPTGTIKFTIRNGSNGAGDVVTGTCVLDLSTDPEKNKLNCESNSAENTPENGRITSAIRYMLLADNKADRVKAEYSGDTLFRASESTVKLFKTKEKIDTKLDLKDSYKLSSGLSGVHALLSWPVKDENGNSINEGMLPTGTIIFTIGSDSCKLTFDDSSGGNVKEFTCSEKDVTEVIPSAEPVDPDEVITWNLLNILLSGGNTSDRIKAEYSGDVNFNPSASEFDMFRTIATDIVLTEQSKTTEGKINVKSSLYWYEVPPEGKRPTGKIKFTAGSASCTVLIDPAAPYITDCPGLLYRQEVNENTEENRPKWIIYELRDLKFGDGTEQSIKAEYSGDGLFLPSVSEEKPFDLYDTETIIRDARPETNGSFDLIIDQRWDQSGTGTNDPLESDNDALRPTGTIKITAGSASCTLQINYRKDPKFTDCDARQASLVYVKTDGYWYPQFQIYGLKIGDGTASSIKAEYSGDISFRNSVSEMIFFTQVDTEIEIDKDKTYRHDIDRVDLEATLSWCYYGCGKEDRIIRYNPTGPVTFTIGGDSCKLDLSNGSFSCADYQTAVDISDISSRQDGNKWYKDWEIKLTDILLSNGSTADRVKADFAGDKVFNPSSSRYVLFPVVPTDLRLSDQEKMPEGPVNVKAELTWKGYTPPASASPAGTIKFTSGSAVCTLDLSTKKFTDCQGSVSVEPDGNYVITGLNFGSGAGGDIKAEYSGDGLFGKSASDKLSFTKVDTELVISSAYKAQDPGLADIVSLLSWDKEKAATRKPTGTVKFTAGSGSCELDLSTAKLSCDSRSAMTGEIPGEDRLSLEMEIAEMLLADSSADRVKAEYSGDAVFNPSSTETELFRTVDTEIRIASAIKNNDKHATARALLAWDETESEGRIPTGTVKFVVGSGSCVLTIETGKLSCEPGTGTVSADRKDYFVQKMLLDDSSADRISAEYSGDGFFKPSTSTKVLFDRIDTEITAEKAYRYAKNNEGYIWLKSMLSWNEDEAEEYTPTGTIRITIGTKTAEYDLTAKTLKVDGNSVDSADIVDVDDNLHNFLFQDLQLDARNAATAKIEYTGDMHFGPSSADIEFDKISTAMVITKVDYKNNEDTGQTIIDVYEDVNKLTEIEILKDVKKTGIINITVQYGRSDANHVIKSCNLHIEDLMIGGENATCTDGTFSAALWEQTQDKNYKIITKYKSNTTLLEATVTVKYLGYYEGVNVDSLFDDSNNAKYRKRNPDESEPTMLYDSTLTVLDAVQLCDGRKYLKFKIAGPHNNTDLTRIYGKLYITTSNGKSCYIDTTYEGDFVSDCGPAEDISKDNMYDVQNWTLKNMSFDPDKAEKIYVNYLGTDFVNGSFGESKYSGPDATTLSFGSLTNNSTGGIDATLSLDFTPNDLIDKVWPGGSIQISKGNYTCTVPLRSVKERYAPVLGADCGGGAAIVYLNQGSDSPVHIDLTGLPAGDNGTTEVKAVYTGDWYYERSEITKALAGRTDSLVEASFQPAVAQYAPYIYTKISGPGNSVVPSGSVTYRYNNSGKSCKVNISINSTVSVDGDCGRIAGTTVSGNYIEYNFYPSSIDPSDTYVEITYSGNRAYNPSSKTIRIVPYTVALIPEPGQIYSDGRYYFNTKDVVVRYPLYPERYGSNAYAYCQSASASDPECRTLLHTFQLTARIELESAEAVLPTDSVLTFSFDDGTPNIECSPNQISPGVYRCTTGDIWFTAPGAKKVTVSYAGSNNALLPSASAEFPEMTAIALSDSLIETTTLIDQPAQVNVGETVTVKAKTFKTGDPDAVVSGASYLYYTYDRVNNHRIQTCSEEPCSLAITEDTAYIVAEFYGNDQYAPSMGMKSISSSPVSLSVDLEP